MVMEKKQIGNFRYGMIYLTFQTYFNLFLATVFSILVCAAIKFLFADSVLSFILMGTVALLLNGGMVYQFMWRQGDKESNFVQFERMEKNRFKGFKVGTLAMIPYVVLDVLLALSKLGMLGFDFLRAYRIFNAPIYGFMKLVNAGDISTLSWGKFVILALMPLIYFVFCGAGYELGFRKISIKDRLIYKN